MCAIIRKPTVSRPLLRRHADVLLGDIGLGAVGGHRIVCTPQSTAIFRWSTVPMPGSSSAETFGLLHPWDTARQVFLVAVRRGSRSSPSAAEAVAVGHLDQRDAGLVQAHGDVDHLV
jgi:hypothetical protein